MVGKSPRAVSLHNAVAVSQQRLGKRVAQLSPARMNEVVCCCALLSVAMQISYWELLCLDPNFPQSAEWNYAALLVSERTPEGYKIHAFDKSWRSTNEKPPAIG